jgi:predicted amidohydrolase
MINVTLIQSDIIWEDRISNLKKYQEKLNQIESTDLIILPEMFTTGFSMSPKDISEKMDGETIQWMKQNAHKMNSAICGSIIIEEDTKYFNRFIWVNPDGSIHHYDKRHLFSFAGENENYTPGNEKIIIEYKGWKICPLICYDLRFPVWSRNSEDYDLLIYVANWPDKRKSAWKSLLTARAIENQCYVIGVNRVGEDSKNYYSGDSSLINALGETLYTNSHIEETYSNTISKYDLNKIRTQLPFLNDKDNFKIIDLI